MLPTNVYSFMKKMVSNTEGTQSGGGGNGSSYGSLGAPTPPGAMGRLRQTLQQAQETVSNRLTSNKNSPSVPSLPSTTPLNTTESDIGGYSNSTGTPTGDFKEIIVELPRPGSAGRCRVCVKAMKPDEYSRECTECGLCVCDDCASYSQNADGNETKWRCSVCRRKGVAIIARRVQPGIEASEALEGVGFETTVRRSPDSRRLQAGGRADSETEVLLLAPRASDVRRHSDVPLRDIAKFQAQTLSSAGSSNTLGASLNGGDKAKARSSSEIGRNEDKSNSNTDKPDSKPEMKLPLKVDSSKTKQGQVKRQRSYERGVSEGNLNLPANSRGRRASCDLRAIDPSALNLTNPESSGSSGSDTAEKINSKKHSNVTSNSLGGKGKEVQRGTDRRRSVQVTSSSKPNGAPRMTPSLDSSNLEKDSPSSTPVPLSMRRQGSSTDGESIKIVIDDVDSTQAKETKSSGEGGGELRTRVVRLRRDPADRGYQTRGFGIRVVGGCSSAQSSPGHLRARVARVTGGSGADFAGIRRGDVVLTWNGTRLTNLTFEEVCKVMDASGDSVEITVASFECDALMSSAVPENEATPGINSTDWEDPTITTIQNDITDSSGDRNDGMSSSNRRRLPRLPGEGRIQLRLFNDEIHNTLEIAVVNIAFGQEDCNTLDLNDIVITLRIGDKVATTRWNQCTLFTKVSPEDLFDSWLVLDLSRGAEFLGEAHVDMGRVSLDDRPVWFPFTSKGTSSHRGSLAQILSNNQIGTGTPSARELARRLRMRGLGAGSQSQSEEQDDSSGQSSPCASSLLRPEVAWEVLGTLGPPGTVLTCRSAPTSRRGSAQSDRGVIGVDEATNERGSLPSTPQMPRSLPPSRRGSFAVAVEEIINRTRRSSVAIQPRVVDSVGRLLPEIPDGMDPSMMRNRRNSAWSPRESGFDRRTPFDRTDSLRTINPPQRRVSADFRDFRNDGRGQPRKPSDVDENWRQQGGQGQQWS